MPNDFRKKILHVFALNALALAQPFFDALVYSPTFLIAHRIGPVDIILLTVVLMAGLPCLLIAIIFLSGYLSKKLYEGVFILIFVLLSSLTALHITKEIPSYSGSTQAILALLIGLTTYVIYRRYQPVKLFFNYLAPLVLFFPANFLFNTEATKLLFPYAHEHSYPASNIKNEKKAPIFLIVLDEFPITSLMDEKGMIDSVRYPNFHELSKNSNWFRNAVAVSEWTDVAVPAILTGQYPSQDRTQIPMLEDYPDNLFTLLEPHYEFEVFEEVTHLCSSEKCGNPQLSELPKRTLQIYSDLLVLFGHLALPHDYSIGLPPIQNRWKNFKERRGEKGNVYDERLEQFEDFIGSINSKNKSTLYFLHLTLPHSPTIYLPSGKAYDETYNMIIGRDPSTDSWSTDSWLVTQAYQRHLLQVGYTDRLMGRIIQKMKALGIYDEALLIVTADHGISFLPGELARGYTQFNYPDILSVPLFIKLPHQKKGAIRDETVKVIDILPAIASTIGLPVPWTTDGENPFKPDKENTENRKLADQVKIQNNPLLDILKFPRDPYMKYKTLKKKHLLFGSGPENLLYKIGPGKDLLGLKIEYALENKLIARVEAEIHQPGPIAQVSKDNNFMPSWITGRVRGLDINYYQLPLNRTPFLSVVENPDSTIQFNPFPIKLAIGVNGVIQATTQTGYFSNLEWFAALIPENALHEGANKISVFKIIEQKNLNSHSRTIENKIPYYQPNKKSYVWNKNKIQYQLIQDPDESFSIMDFRGNKFKIPQKKGGAVEAVKLTLEAMYFIGWIYDWKNQNDKTFFLIFNKDQLVFVDQAIIPKNAGFPQTNKMENASETIFRIPVYQNKKVNLNDIRIFLMSEKTGIHEMNIFPNAFTYPEALIPKHQFYGALSYCEDERTPAGNKTGIVNKNNFSDECF
jgi:hypothetical protein